MKVLWNKIYESRFSKILIFSVLDQDEKFDVCSTLLIIVSYVLVAFTFPISLCCCIKVNENIGFRVVVIGIKYFGLRLLRNMNEQ